MELGKTYRYYIHGEWREAGDDMTYPVYSPGDNDLLVGNFPLSTKEGVAKEVTAAHRAFLEWRELAPSKRTEYLYRFSELLDENKDGNVKAAMLEQGKIYREY